MRWARWHRPGATAVAMHDLMLSAGPSHCVHNAAAAAAAVARAGAASAEGRRAAAAAPGCGVAAAVGLCPVRAATRQRWAAADAPSRAPRADHRRPMLRVWSASAPAGAQQAGAGPGNPAPAAVSGAEPLRPSAGVQTAAAARLEWLSRRVLHPAPGQRRVLLPPLLQGPGTAAAGGQPAACKGWAALQRPRFAAPQGHASGSVARCGTSAALGLQLSTSLNGSSHCWARWRSPHCRRARPSGGGWTGHWLLPVDRNTPPCIDWQAEMRSLNSTSEHVKTDQLTGCGSIRHGEAAGRPTVALGLSPSREI